MPAFPDSPVAPAHGAPSECRPSTSRARTPSIRRPMDHEHAARMSMNPPPERACRPAPDGAGPSRRALRMPATGLTWFLLSILVASTEAQTVYISRRYTTADGLPQSWARALAQTPDGYLWIGTLFGLARFDGQRFVTFDHVNTPALRRDAINALEVDARDGALWLATEVGVIHHDGRIWKRAWPEGDMEAQVHHLAPDDRGGVWFMPDGATLAHLDANGLVERHGVTPRLAKPPSTLDATPAGILLGHLGRLELWQRNLSPPRWVSVPLPSPGFYPSRRLHDGALLGFDPSDFWRASWTGADVHWIRVPGLPNPATIPNYPGFLTGPDGQAWVHLRPGGTWNLSTSPARPVIGPDLTEHDEPTQSLVDREGTLWIGNRSDLIQLSARRLQVIGSPPAMAALDVQSISGSPDGTVWIAHASGLHAWKDGVLRGIELLDLPPPKGLARVLPAQDGSLWIVAGPLWQRSAEGTWKPRFVDELPRPIHALHQTRDGSLWVSAQGGVRRIRGDICDLVVPTTSREGEVRTFFEARDGALWLGTFGHGLARWKDGQVDTWKTDKGEFNNRMWMIHEDSRGALWIGTQNGLNRFADGRFFTFNTEHGLGESVVNHVLEDDTGHLWLGGLRGIYRVARSELEAVADGRESRVRCVQLGEADGMLSAETNGEYTPSACRDAEGNLWFPTPKGAVRIDPRRTVVNDLPPHVILEHVVADDEVLLSNLPGSGIDGGGAVLRLAPGRARSMEFRFTAPTFVGARLVRFRYRLIGHDPDWRPDTQERTAPYTNLKPGAYRFEVVAANAHGAWQRTPATFSFILEPRFAETGWYPASIAGVALALGAIAFAWRLRWHRRALRAENASALAEERARIARDLHDDLGTALTGVAFNLDLLERTQDPVSTAAHGTTSTRRLRDAARRVRALATRMREVVWAANPDCDNVPSFALFLEQQAVPLLRAAGLRVRLDYPDPLPVLGLQADVRYQLFVAIRESLHNVVRHAGATEVELRMTINEHPPELRIEVRDDGRGFDIGAPLDAGNGLKNLRERLARLGGTFECASQPGSGTRALFSVPLPQASPLPPPAS